MWRDRSLSQQVHQAKQLVPLSAEADEGWTDA